MKTALPSTGQTGKMPYRSPTIVVHMVEMEQGIAASSVVPTDPSGEILEEWELGEDREGDIAW